MSDKLHLELISPEKALVSADVDSLVAFGSCGEVGILPGHSTYFTSLQIGSFSYCIGDHVIHVAVSKGFMQVVDDKVIVLTEKCEFGSDIDIQEAKELKIEAEKAMESSKNESHEAFKVALHNYQYHDTRVKTAEKSK